MLQNAYTQPRFRGDASRRPNRPVEAAEARMNPWLLWRPERPHAPQFLTVAELADCRCPDICNRDHANE